MCTTTTCAGIISCSKYSSSCTTTDVVCSWANPYSVWIAASCRSEIVLWMVENFSDKLVYLLLFVYEHFRLHVHFGTIIFTSDTA